MAKGGTHAGHLFGSIPAASRGAPKFSLSEKVLAVRRPQRGRTSKHTRNSSNQCLQKERSVWAVACTQKKPEQCVRVVKRNHPSGTRGQCLCVRARRRLLKGGRKQGANGTNQGLLASASEGLEAGLYLSGVEHSSSSACGTGTSRPLVIGCKAVIRTVPSLPPRFIQSAPCNPKCAAAAVL